MAKTTRERQEAIRDDALARLAKLQASGDEASSATIGIEIAGQHARMWGAVAALAVMSGELKDASSASIQANKWAEQQVRAQKATLADRLDALEARRDERVAAANGLRLLG